MFVTAIIAAGGRGARLGAAQPKQLLYVGGRAILERSVAAFLAHPGVDQVIVVLPADLAAAPPDYLRHGNKPLLIVAGGRAGRIRSPTRFGRWRRGPTSSSFTMRRDRSPAPI
jgi:2-C-methyl-D-erythritol 4-phosphate cytidylyltransferase